MDEDVNVRSDIGMDARATRTRAAQAQPYGNMVGGLGRLAPQNECDQKASQEPLRFRVERRLTRISNDADALMRVQAILNEHPEFEQLIELQNLINRHGI